MGLWLKDDDNDDNNDNGDNGDNLTQMLNILIFKDVDEPIFDPSIHLELEVLNVIIQCRHILYKPSETNWPHWSYLIQTNWNQIKPSPSHLELQNQTKSDP